MTETEARAVLAHNQRGRMMDEPIYIEDEKEHSGLLEEE